MLVKPALCFALAVISAWPAAAASRIQGMQLCEEGYYGRNEAYKGMSEQQAYQARIDACGKIIDDHSQSAANRARALFNRADTYTSLSGPNRRKYYELAVQDFSAVIALDPNDAEAYSKRASDYYSLGRTDLALKDQMQVVRLKPDKYQSYQSRATYYWYVGDEAHALEDLTRVIEISAHERAIAPRNMARYAVQNLAQQYSWRARRYEQLKDYKRALDDYTQAVKADPKDESHLYDRADVYAKLGEFKLALADYDKAIRLSPKSALPIKSRAAFYQKQGNFGAALADLNKAIALDPKYSFSYWSRAEVFMAKGDREHALADFGRAIEVEPTPLQYQNRAVAYLTFDDPTHALQDFEAALKKQDDLWGGRSRLELLLWIDLVRRRLGLPSTLSENVAETDNVTWPEPLIRLLLGQASYEYVLGVAQSYHGGWKTEAVCMLKYFWGDKQASEGKPDGSILLHDVINDCGNGRFSDAAKSTLKRASN